jgi:hypothetical protein
MVDLTWLSQEAKNLHQMMESLFYILVATLLVLAIVVEYLKFPIGQIPSFGPLIGRVVIAAILLQCFPEICNTIADLSDALSKQVGDLNKFDVMREKLAQRFHSLSVSWLSVKEGITIIVCYVVFIFFHFAYYMAEAFLLFTWTLLYIFSPILIALFIIPSTSQATSGLFRSLIEVSLWKPVWAILGTLLWSLSISEINKPQTEINFLSVISLVLILAASLLMTPAIIHFLAGAGVAAIAPNIGRLGMGPVSVAPIDPARVLSKTKGAAVNTTKRTYNAGLNSSSQLSKKHFPRTHKVLEKIPRIRVPASSLYIKRNNKKENKT